jgi:hypothetical protein
MRRSSQAGRLLAPSGDDALGLCHREPGADQIDQHTRTQMALHFTYYNFVRIHKTLRTTPAMAAGVTKRLWEIGEMVDMLEAWEATV